MLHFILDRRRAKDTLPFNTWIKAKMPTIYLGTIVHTKSFNEFESFKEGFVAVQDGKVENNNDKMKHISIQLILYRLLA